MKKFIKKSVLLAATMSMLALGACNLFAPRKAENPETPTPWNTFFINSTLTVQNLVYSYNYQQNALKFGDILSTHFTFHFAIQDVKDFGTLSYWNADNEKEMLVNLHKNLSSKNVQMILELTPLAGQPDQIAAANAWIYRSYEIHIIGQTKDISIYKGRCALFLESDNGFWKIRDWYDYRTETEDIPDPSWGQLKYYQDNLDV